MSQGKPVNFEDLEDMDEETTLGRVGKIEDFTWKDRLDFTTCTECGRCQSQCPAWNTEKPLSPKLLTLRLRDHAYAKAPYSLAKTDEDRAALPGDVLTEAERPLVGTTEGDWAWDPTGGAVIDDDVLWSCTSPVAPACSSAPSTSNTSTTSSTCAAIRCWSSRTSRPSSTVSSRAWKTRATRGT
jgi:ferredoxin